MEVRILKTSEFVVLSKVKVSVFSVLWTIVDLRYADDSSGSEKK